MASFNSFNVAILAFLGILIFFVVINLILWIFQAIGLQRLGNRNNINNSWVAWLPIGDLWVLGKISDTRKNFWKIEDTGKLFVIISVVQIIIGVIMLLGGVSAFFTNLSFDLLAESEIFSYILYGGIEFFDFLFGLSGGLILLLKFWSLYNVYSKYKGDKGVIFLILSIIFQFMIPIFLFAIRNEEENLENPVIENNNEQEKNSGL